ncbi:hypothetical protein ACFQS3_01110 [Glycomyces mayteni]|uniref:Uncharacterized protein n=1 Tax=Glycomyces mayteni TaxID=543887 RepID=A0ABW2D0L6_9ACTN|nr:hypothetical protein GCM10025732_44770 [Glycomyces mayteni]
MRIRTRIAAAAGVIAAASATGVAVAALGAPAEDRAAPETEEVLLAQGSDHLPSITAADWVTYADHVIVVEAVAEEAIEPEAEELDRGEGIIGRTVSLVVEDVLWSREGAPQAAPETWEYSALGWHFNAEAEDPIEMALDGFPRVEVGHQYVMAIRWEEAVCTEGGDSRPAQWRGLGEGSEIPFDGGTLGNGESEGTVKSAAAFAADEDVHVDEGVEEILAGEDADALVAALADAKPDAAALSEVQALAAADSCA